MKLSTWLQVIDTLSPSPSSVRAIGILYLIYLGDVYVWGRGREGQHGNGKRHHITLAPVRVAALDSERVAKVVAGTRHCVAITHEGNVYLWGMLHRFQERSAIEYFGEKVDLPGMSKKASAPQPEEGSDWERKRAEMLEQSHRSYYSAGAVEESSKDGQSRELSNFGQFQALFQTTPLPLSSLNGKVRIVGGAAGYSFTFLITSEGDVYGFGFNEKRQLGLGHRYNLETPQVNKTLKAAGAKVVKITCGQQHVLALTSEGHVWSWGLGVFGQLGHGETHDEGLPRRIEAFKEMCIVDIGCGANHSLALDDQGRVFSWGSSEYGQQGGRNEYTVPLLLPPLPLTLVRIGSRVLPTPRGSANTTTLSPVFWLSPGMERRWFVSPVATFTMWR